MEYFQIGGNSVSNRVFCRRDLNESTRGQKCTHTHTHRFFYCKGGEAEIVAHLIVTRVQFPWPPAKRDACKPAQFLIKRKLATDKVANFNNASRRPFSTSLVARALPFLSREHFISETSSRPGLAARARKSSRAKRTQGSEQKRLAKYAISPPAPPRYILNSTPSFLVREKEET